MTERSALDLKPLCASIGAQVIGVDLGKGLDADTASAVQKAFYDHQCLLFRAQRLEPRAQIAFTRLFGEPQPHPLKTRPTVEGMPEVLILQNRPGRPGARNDYWHSDISHSPRPPSASILYAKQVPEGRGDTMICSMYAAWEQLSQGMREMLEGLRSEHSAEPTMKRNNMEATDGLPIASVPPPSFHPVARTHPKTGRKALYVNPHFTMAFQDMTREESKGLLDFLTRHATRPENIYRHRWQVGDVLMWDNRCTMHYALRDYDDSMSRLMHRTTASGEEPA